MKVKIFNGAQLSALELEINEWLAGLTSQTVIHRILQSESDSHGYAMLTITICYTEGDNDNRA